ncbi:MAG: hypothetical protein ACK5NF_07795 [Bacilli bacterium]
MKTLEKKIIANPNVFEIGKPSEFAKKVIAESKGIKIGTSGFKKANESK